MQHSPARVSRATNSILTNLLAITLLAGCATADAPGAAAPPDEGAVAAAAAPDVAIDGADLVLTTTDGPHVVATVDDAELLHAVVRPGVHDAVTVLALTRVEDRYELRYLSASDGEITDLYWFPARLQISPDTAQVRDVPTLPVWSPDGSALAWLEWNAEGTRLRTVGWFDHELGTNPSDDQATYALADVPVGAQLDVWEVADDGVPVLVTRGEGDARWRIRLEGGEPIVALDRLR